MTDNTNQRGDSSDATGSNRSSRKQKTIEAQRERNDETTGFEFTDGWTTVEAENDDVSADHYPVLRALGRAAQLEAR